MSLATDVPIGRLPGEMKGHPGLLFDLGLEHHRAGRLAQAEALYRAALASDSDHADSLHLLGMIAYQFGDLETAAKRIERAIAIHPYAVSYHVNLGNVLQKQGLAKAAATSYLRALTIKPNLAEVHVNLANLFLEAERPEVAVTWYRSGLSINPEMPEAQRQLGHALRQLSHLEDALAAYDRAIELKPDDAGAHDWAARVLREMGDLGSALDRFRQAQAIDPKHPRAGFGEALVQLLQGEYEAGWRNYERRWESSDHATPSRGYSQPKWRGERVDSGRVFLWPEQGVGDEIMFAGLLPDVIRTGSRCVLACDARLQPLLARSFPAVEVIADTPPKEGEMASLPQEFHAQLPIGSLPELFRKTGSDFAGDAPPYLIPDPVKRTQLRERYADGRRRLVGVSWYSKNGSTGVRRSIEFQAMAKLFAEPRFRWVSLQYDEPGTQVDAAMAAGTPCWFDDAIDQTTDMDGYAAQVAAMDLVITIDNTTAHLAGAMGVPVWLLLPFGPDWRWLAKGETSPWYPSMRVFRQTRRGDWETVLEEVQKALSSMASMA